MPVTVRATPTYPGALSGAYIKCPRCAASVPPGPAAAFIKLYVSCEDCLKSAVATTPYATMRRRQHPGTCPVCRIDHAAYKGQGVVCSGCGDTPCITFYGRCTACRRAERPDLAAMVSPLGTGWRSPTPIDVMRAEVAASFGTAPKSACECGVGKVGGIHSDWCPKYSSGGGWRK